MGKSGFTLVEIIIAVSISILTLTGTAFFFKSATHTLIDLGISSRPPIDMANFGGAYRDLRVKYPNLWYQTGALLSNSDTAFTMSAFKNNSMTAAIVVGAMDRRSKQVVLGFDVMYAPYTPFIIQIGSAELLNFDLDPLGWTNDRLATLYNPYSKIELARLDARMLTGAVVRLDLDIISTIDTNSYDKQKLKQFRSNPEFEFIPLSIVR